MPLRIAILLVGITVPGLGGLAARGAEPTVAARDPRNLVNGLTIASTRYCDQPYVVVTRDRNWLCVFTTGTGEEGAKGQHVVSTISTDQGKTWSRPVDIEPADGPEASWAVPLVTPGGRVYVFYDYNGDRVRTLRGNPVRADMLGWYVFKYSDDNGRSWSRQRYRLPMRVTACDRGNDWQGRVQIFWGICKPRVAGTDVYFAFTKLGKHLLDNGEGWVYRSDNLLTEKDPAKVRWDLWPTGEHGIRADAFGSIQEEHNLVQVEGKRLYCVYRTTNGFPCQAYSDDGGRSWDRPQPMTYTPGGRTIKTPRACPMLWRTREGKFLFWFHHHGGKTFHGRNPVWILGGVERAGRIHWSQPEVLLYGPVGKAEMSYPDLIEQDGRFWFTETEKSVARVHEVDRRFLEGLWQQDKVRTVAATGRVLDLAGEGLRVREVELEKRWNLQTSPGLTLDFWVRFNDLSAGQVLLDNRGPDGRGTVLKTTAEGTLRIELNDGGHKATWDCDPGVLRPRTLHHVVVLVDAGPQLLSFVVDGVHGDGGAARTHGWTRWEGALGDVSGRGKLRLAPSLRGELRRLRVYERPLRTYEAVAHYRAGP
jgi:hypothetical protein